MIRTFLRVEYSQKKKSEKIKNFLDEEKEYPKDTEYGNLAFEK